MPNDTEVLLVMLLRASVMLTLGWVVFWSLLKQLKLRSVRLQAIAWFAVLMQGVLLIPIPVEVPITAAFASASRDAEIAIPTAQNLFDSTDGGSRLRDWFPEQEPRLEATRSFLKFTNIFAACWLCGVIGSVGWMFTTYIKFAAGLPRTLPVPAEWEAEWNGILGSSTLQGDVALHVTADIGPAICWTFTGYRLLIPSHTWGSLSSQQRELVMRHELAHLERGDLWKALCYRLLAAVQWFNPLAWQAVRQLAECAEWDCDDRASQAASTEYVRALLEFSLPPRGTPVLMPHAIGHSLVRRAQRLLNPTFTEDSGMKKLTLTLAVAALVAAGFVDFHLVAQDTPPTEQPKTDLASTDRLILPADGAVPILRFESVPLIQPTAEQGAVVQLGEPLQPEALKRQFATKEAVIDMQHLFAQLPEFQEMREAIQKYLAERQAALKADIEVIRAIDAKLAISTGTDAATLRSEADALKVKLEIERKAAQTKAMKMESEAYLATFKKIRKAVAAYAREHDIHIVRRMTGEREQEKQLDSGDPQAIIKALNAQVVYISDESIDITEAILQRLKAEEKAAGEKAR